MTPAPGRQGRLMARRPILHTPRLELVPMGPEHLPLLVELDGDPEVMRHVLGRARTPAEAREHWSAICGDVTADVLGLGFWVGFVGAEWVGWWSLWPEVPDDGGRVEVAEVGWRLRRAWWRRGLATEGARAVLDHGYAAVGLSTVRAETMAVNLASRGVMRRLGMREVRVEVREWDRPLPGAEDGEVVAELTR